VDDDRAAAEGADLRGSLLRDRGLLAIVHRDVGALARELHGGGAPDAARAPVMSATRPASLMRGPAAPPTGAPA
jgi:hypothetical protein